MRLTNDADYWQRHYVIAQSLTAFFELELKYPSVAAMVQSGIINITSDNVGSDKVCKGDPEVQGQVFGSEPTNGDAGAQNQAWCDFVKSICGLASQVFYASMNRSGSEAGESESQRELREHGEATISMMVAPYWKSLGRYGKHWIYDERLKDFILEVVRRQKDLNRPTIVKSGNPNA